ncbi:MAG: YebG family protein [Pseudomonadota bacterium]
MAVEVRYLVIRDGKEVGMYTSKKEADAHDKMLDIAESLFAFIEKAAHIDLKENQLEELSIYLSHNREEVIRILKGAPPQPLEPENRDSVENSDLTTETGEKIPFREKKSKRAAE